MMVIFIMVVIVITVIIIMVVILFTVIVIMVNLHSGVIQPAANFSPT